MRSSSDRGYRYRIEYTVRQPVVAHELPDILDGVELRTFGRQRNESDILWNGKPVRHVPSRLIEDKHGVRARTDLLRDFGEMQVHRFAVTSRHDEPRTLAVARTDRAENVG